MFVQSKRAAFQRAQAQAEADLNKEEKVDVSGFKPADPAVFYGKKTTTREPEEIFPFSEDETEAPCSPPK